MIYVNVDAGTAIAEVEALEGALMGASLGMFLAGPGREILAQRAAERFASEGDDASGDWAALRRKTAEIRAQLGFGAYHPINERTGELYAFVVGSEGDLTVGESEAALQWPDVPTGDVAIKYNTAQTGSRTGQVARPVVAVNETDTTLMTEALSSWISDFSGLAIW